MQSRRFYLTMSVELKYNYNLDEAIRLVREKLLLQDSDFNKVESVSILTAEIPNNSSNFRSDGPHPKTEATCHRCGSAVYRSGPNVGQCINPKCKVEHTVINPIT
jgi:hypothetical protein